MNQSNLLLSVPESCETIVFIVSQALQQSGLRSVRSFDLNVARSLHADCKCPNHGTELCDCQIVILLVYGQNSSPATLYAHGRDGQTQLHLVDNPQQHPEPELELSIRQAIMRISKHKLNQGMYRNVT